MHKSKRIPSFPCSRSHRLWWAKDDEERRGLRECSDNRKKSQANISVGLTQGHVIFLLEIARTTREEPPSEASHAQDRRI